MAETKFISRIKVPTGDVYEIKDVELSNVYKKTETSSAADISSAFWRKITVDNRISGTISHPDLSVIKLDAAEYANLLTGDKVLSDAIYVVEDDHIDAYGQQIKNIALPTDLSDAVTKEYVDNAVSSIQIPTDLSDLSNSPGYVTSASISSSLADIQKSVFESISDPAASVRSLQETLISVLNILRGIK